MGFLKQAHASPFFCPLQADAIHKKDQEGQLWRFCQQVCHTTPLPMTHPWCHSNAGVAVSSTVLASHRMLLTCKCSAGTIHTQRL